jgi:hypothetical protein
MTDETLPADEAVGGDSLDPVAVAEVAPEETAALEGAEGHLEASNEPSSEQYQPPVEARVGEYPDTNTPPPAMRPCPAGPEPHRLAGRE